MIPLTSTPSDPLEHLFLLPAPAALNSAGSETLVLAGKGFLPGGTTNIPLTWKLRPPSGHCGLLVPLS